MRSCLLGLLGLILPGLAVAQEFHSPLDVVSTLYGTYFLNVQVTDIRPYFSERFTTQLGGTIVGHKQFEAAGLDPLTGQLDWDPRSFDLSILFETADRAEVQASFLDSANPTSVVFHLVKEDRHGWQIDHLAGKSGDLTWCTKSIVSLATP